MGLTDQQHLYMLPNYFLLYNSDDEVVGLLTQSQLNGSTLSKLEENGYHTELVNFDALNMKATKILKDLKINKNNWLTAQEYMEKLNEYRK